jgi:MoxR-like ATPase
MTDWKLFRGNCNNEPKALTTIPEPPPWRKFKPIDQVDQKTDNEYWKQLLAKQNQRAIARGRCFQIQTDENGYSEIVDAVNAAIHLRRPLMVTGVPGMGKTSLPYAIAYELQLGPVLVWPITARSTVQDALYRYDAIARLQDAQLDKMRREDSPDNDRPGEEGNLGDYIQLGPVGTAFLPSRRPRVLLIDEIDKSDLNLPNDLLNLFEEGNFNIQELVRRKRQNRDNNKQNSESKGSQDSIETVSTADGLEVDITNGWVECCEFPIVIMTSNGEREFPPAFYRRCLRVEMPKPTPESLLSVVQSHFNVNGNDWTATEEQLDELIEEFLGRDRKADRATDQLLNAVYLMTRKGSPGEDDMEKLKKLLFKRLSQGS